MLIEREKLLTALEPLQSAFPARTMIEAQTQIWFDKKYAYAHDGGFGVRSAIETPFDFGVSGKVLIGLLEQSEAEEVSLEATDVVLTFKAGKSVVRLPTMAKSSRPTFYPAEPKAEPVATLTVTPALIAGLSRVFVLRPGKAKRLEHYGVCIFPAGTELDLFTTNSRAIAVMPVSQKFDGRRMVLPRLFAEQVVARCEIAMIKIYKDHMQVPASASLRLYSNMFDATDLRDLQGDVDALYDLKAAPPFTIPKGFDEALQRAAMMVSSQEDALVELTTDGKKLTVSGEFRAGEFLEEFDVDEVLPKRTVSVLVKPLMKMDLITKMMVGPNAVVLCGDDDFLYFLALGA